MFYGWRRLHLRKVIYFCFCGLQPKALYPESTLFIVHLRPAGSKPFKGVWIYTLHAFVLNSTAAKEKNNVFLANIRVWKNDFLQHRLLSTNDPSPPAHIKPYVTDTLKLIEGKKINIFFLSLRPLISLKLVRVELNTSSGYKRTWGTKP